MAAVENASPVVVPDTLDLGEKASLAINGILGTTDPDLDFEPYLLSYFDVHPAYMIHYSATVSGVLPKYVEAMPLLRFMSGSDQDRDLEEGMLASIVANSSEDGMIYDRARPDRPWNAGFGYGLKGWNEDYANIAGNGRLLRGFLHYYQLTGDEVWRERAQRTAERMLELAVVKDDYAYYPNVGCGNDYSYPRESGWVHTNEPGSAQEGAEGTMLFYLLQPVRGFARWYALTGDERFLDLSRRLVNFGLRRKWWGGLGDIEPLAGSERGHFWGHYHGSTAALIGLLDYAVIADDWRVKEFVRDGYEWGRLHGIHRLGVFPSTGGHTEGCTIADMVALAAALTDAGVGDYWDDVDQYARNGLLAVQASDGQEMERVSQAGRERPENAAWGSDSDQRFRGLGGVLPGQETTDRVVRRLVGTFGFLDGARYLAPHMCHCCTGNGSQALYYAWEGIARRSGQTAEVNLWMNRRSRWVDVWSWLPYEGKLVVRNKGMKRVSVRLPGWASRSLLRCTVDGNDVQPDWIGNRAVFTGLRGEEELALVVPVAVENSRYTLANLNQRERGGPDEYDCQFRGNTLIGLGEAEAHPGGRELAWYRTFRRDHMRAADAPMKEATTYVHPEKVVRW